MYKGKKQKTIWGNIFRALLIFLFCLFAIIVIIVFFAWFGVQMNLFSTSALFNFQGLLTIGEYVHHILGALGLGVTICFSYSLLIVSKESNKLSKSINDREKKRDYEIIKNSASYIFLDLKGLIYKASGMKMEYAKHNVELSNRNFNEEHKWRNDFVNFKNLSNESTEWKKHIPVIRGEIKENDVNYEEIFNLYLAFETPILYAREGELRSCIVSIPKEILTDEFNQYFDDSDVIRWEYSRKPKEVDDCVTNAISTLNKYIKRAEELEEILNNKDVVDIVNTKWKDILAKLEKISTTDFRKIG
ncbi:MAG: hypothetical protein ACLKAK_10000 [Alkaliphilus sp.]